MKMAIILLNQCFMCLLAYAFTGEPWSMATVAAAYWVHFILVALLIIAASGIPYDEVGVNRFCEELSRPVPTLLRALGHIWLLWIFSAPSYATQMVWFGVAEVTFSVAKSFLRASGVLKFKGA